MNAFKVFQWSIIKLVMVRFPGCLGEVFRCKEAKKERRKDFYVFMASSSKNSEPPLPIRALKCVVKQIFNALNEQVFLQSRLVLYISMISS